MRKYDYSKLAPKGPNYPPKTVYEPSTTEQAGYRSTRQQVEKMIRAGEQLIAARREEFHFGADDDQIPEGFFDPTVDPGFDRVDAFEAEEAIRERARQRGALETATRKPQEPGESDSETRVEDKDADGEVSEDI